jgi:hypothetical protein
MIWAVVWATFSRTHRVTLARTLSRGASKVSPTHAQARDTCVWSWKVVVLVILLLLRVHHSGTLFFSSFFVFLIFFRRILKSEIEKEKLFFNVRFVSILCSTVIRDCFRQSFSQK